jgi:hypothetical protein
MSRGSSQCLGSGPGLAIPRSPPAREFRAEPGSPTGVFHMGGSQPRGVLSWEPSPKDDQPTPPTREPPYGRSIGWAIVAWVVTVAAVYLVNQMLPELAGWVGLVGVIVGSWFGGIRGGISGRREWILFGLMMLAILILTIGVGGCVYSMALYG